MRSLFILLILLFSIKINAATNIAASAEYSDVNTALGLCNIGDTLSIPAGSATWTNILFVTNCVRIIGAGTNSTIISNGIPWGGTYPGSGQGVDDNRPATLFYVWIKSAQATNHQLLRFSGMTINCNTNWGTAGGQGIWVDQITVSGNPIVSPIRIDHINFNNCYRRAIVFRGGVYGVVDHCWIRNPYIPWSGDASDFAEWNRFTAPYYSLGTTNTRVMENCTIQWDSGYSVGYAGAISDCGQGGHYVMRYNDIVVSNGYAGGTIDGIDAHGNNQTSNTYSGTICAEWYGNHFYPLASKCSARIANVRGGTIVCFSNTTHYATANLWYQYNLNEEESWSPAVFDSGSTAATILRNSWPAQMQVTNSFFWENKINSTVTNPVLYTPTLSSSTSNTGTNSWAYIYDGVNNWQTNPISMFVQQNRDYWCEAPNATNGSGGTWSGNGTSVPDVGAWSEPGALKDYIPLIYPHPLDTADVITPPTIAITSPTNGVIYAPGLINLVLTTNLGSGTITQMIFSLDDVLTTNSTSLTFTRGNHSLCAQALTDDGTNSYSITNTISVSNSCGIVSGNPSGSFYPGFLTFSCTYTNGDGTVTNINYTLDGTSISNTLSSFTYFPNAGSHSLIFQANDTYGFVSKLTNSFNIITVANTNTPFSYRRKWVH